MVELTVLGSFGPYAPANGACSGYLLEIDGFTIMLDCGHGAFSKLQKYTDYTKLGLLVITHLHPDHYSDIYCLRQALKYAMREGKRTEPLYVYLPEGPSNLVEEFEQWTDVFTVINLQEAWQAENDFNLFKLSFFPVKHSISTYGVKLSVGEKTLLVYTADTGWDNKLVEECKEAEYILAECSLKEFELAERGENHLSAGQAGVLAHSCGAKNLILTHFFPAYQQAQLQRQAEVAFDGKIYLAATGKKYLLG